MIVEVTISILVFLTGYILGRLKRLEISLFGNTSNSKQRNLFGIKSSKTKKPKIDIDESKFVTDVTTSSFKKSFKELGTKSVHKDNISTSISKLNDLKKK